MYHSINIKEIDTDKVINTYDKWRIVPETRPLINPPEVVTEYVEVPGVNGALDYTESLTGAVTYKNRTGSWKFIVLNDDNGHQEWQLLYNHLQTYLHGHTFKVSLEDDPEYEYIGRLTLNEWNSEQHWSTIVINYNFSPFKYLTSDQIADWLWDDLVMNNDSYTIYYGTFDVLNSRKRVLYNPTDHDIPASVTSTAVMTVEYSGIKVKIYTGANENVLTLIPGKNACTFIGTGRITINYDRGGTV